MDPKQTAETFNTVAPLVFWLVAGLTGLCAIATVTTQNIVRAATWLLFTLAGTSGIFFLLGADLVGATQLLVYVGGTLVLVVFGVMLTAQGPFISMKSSGAEWAISVIAGLLLLAVLTTGIISEKTMFAPRVRAEVDRTDKKGKQLGFVTPEVTRYAPQDDDGVPFSRAKRQSAVPVKLSTAAPVFSKGGKGGAPTKQEQGPAGPPGVDKGKTDGKGKGAGKEKGGQKEKGGVAPGEGPPGKGPASTALPADLQPPPDAPPPRPRKEPEPPIDPATSPQSATLGEGFLGVGVGPAHREGKFRIVRTSYLLPFEIVSVHLLVVLIGAAYLARAKRHRGAGT